MSVEQSLQKTYLSRHLWSWPPRLDTFVQATKQATATVHRSSRCLL